MKKIYQETWEKSNYQKSQEEENSVKTLKVFR